MNMADLFDQCGAALGTIEAALADMPMAGDGAERAARLRSMLGDPADLRVRAIGPADHVVYLATIVNQEQLETSLLKPLGRTVDGASERALLARLVPLRTYAEALAAILSGKAVALTAQAPGAFAADVAKWPNRVPSEPPAEVITRGPHTGFVESLDDNIALIRQGVPDPRLRYERFAVATRSGAAGAMLYIEGVVSPAVLAHVRAALDRALASVVTDATMLAQHLSPTAHLFPTVGTTERPDVAYASLLEGRVVMFTAGSPTALLLPQVFAHLLAAPED